VSINPRVIICLKKKLTHTPSTVVTTY